MSLWQRGAVYFYHRAHQNNLPLRMCVSKAGDEFCIKALINYTVVTQPWSRYILVCRMSIAAVERLFEVHQIDAARKAVDICVTFPLCAIKAWASGENKIGNFQ